MKKATSAKSKCLNVSQTTQEEYLNMSEQLASLVFISHEEKERGWNQYGNNEENMSKHFYFSSTTFPADQAGPYGWLMRRK